MRKALLIAFFVFLFALIEFCIYNLLGRLFMPNLLLLLVIYCNLAFGIRYSIWAAVLAGLFKDSFGTGVFGQNMFVFIMCAYAATLLKRYLHYVASKQSRLLLVFFVIVVHVALHFCLNSMSRSINILHVIKFVFIPEVITTLIITSFVFTQLKKCVLKLFA